MRRTKFLAPALLIIIIVFIAYGQTLGMHFWQDDLALLFKLQHLEGRAGSFGEGLWERGSYQYLVVPFVPFFKIFGLEPFGYFLVGLFTYVLAAGAFYLFSKELFQNKKPALFSTVIFAAGYIGSNTMFRIINSWQTNIGLILALLTFWVFTKYLHQKGFVKYIVSVGLFLATIELVFIRSHSLVLPILALDFLIGMSAINIKQISFLIFRQFPFWFLWFQWYLRDPEYGAPGITSFLHNILIKGEVELLSPFFANVGNIIASDMLQMKLISIVAALIESPILWLNILTTIVSSMLIVVIAKIVKTSNKLKVLIFIGLLTATALNLFFITKDSIWYRDLQSQISGLIGMQSVILITYLVIVLWRLNRNISVALSFGLIFLLSQVFGYYSKYPTAIFPTPHRYFSYAFLGFCIIFGSLTYFLTQRFQRKGLLLLIIIVCVNLILSLNYQQKFIIENSIPARKFYTDMKRFLPHIQNGDYFYFDVEGSDFYQRQFSEFFGVGSMPESTALAVYYGVDRYELSRFTDFNEMIFSMNKDRIPLNKIHTFYYGGKGLISTTSHIRSALEKASAQEVLEINDNRSSIVNLQNGNTSPASYILLSFKARILPSIEDIGVNSPMHKPNVQHIHIIDYLLARQNYYKTIKAKSLSEWRSQEIQYIVDNNPSTSWRGHRIYWHEKRKEQVILDLGTVQSMSGVVWTNWINRLTPTSYTIEISQDGNVWTEVKKVRDGKEREAGEIVVDPFDSAQARFVRFTISETLTDDSPALSEIEIISSSFNDIDPKVATEFIASPLNFISNREELQSIISQLSSLLTIQVEWETNKGKNAAQIPIGEFGQMRDHKVILDPGGTILKDISLTIPSIPARIDVSSATLRNLSLKEIKKFGLVKRFVEN